MHACVSVESYVYICCHGDTYTHWYIFTYLYTIEQSFVSCWELARDARQDLLPIHTGKCSCLYVFVCCIGIVHTHTQITRQDLLPIHTGKCSCLYVCVCCIGIVHTHTHKSQDKTSFRYTHVSARAFVCVCCIGIVHTHTQITTHEHIRYTQVSADDMLATEYVIMHLHICMYYITWTHTEPRRRHIMCSTGKAHMCVTQSLAAFVRVVVRNTNTYMHAYIHEHILNQGACTRSAQLVRHTYASHNH